MSTVPTIGHMPGVALARRPIEESDPEPTLFVMKHYAHRGWHTNLPLTPAGVWRFYDGRATYPAISQLASSCYQGGENPASSSQAKTVEGLNLLY